MIRTRQGSGLLDVEEVGSEMKGSSSPMLNLSPPLRAIPTRYLFPAQCDSISSATR